MDAQLFLFGSFSCFATVVSSHGYDRNTGFKTSLRPMVVETDVSPM
jgi:hypothetical protein